MNVSHGVATETLAQRVTCPTAKAHAILSWLLAAGYRAELGAGNGQAVVASNAPASIMSEAWQSTPPVEVIW